MNQMRFRPAARAAGFAATAAVIACAGLAAPAQAAIPTYTGIITYARAGGPTGTADYNVNQLSTASSFTNGASINANREVAFKYTYSDPATENIFDAIWVGNGTADGTRKTTLNTFSDVTINNLGRATWAENSSGAAANGIYRYDLSTNTQGLLTNGPAGTTSFNGPSVNNLNQVGYRANISSVSSYVSYDPATNSFATHETGNVAYQQAFMSGQAFNDARQIAGTVRANGITVNTQDEIRVFNADGSDYRIIAENGLDASSPILSVITNNVSLNNSGQVAFLGSRTTAAGGGQGIFVSDGTTLRTIALTGQNGVAALDTFAPVINNNGLVAFRGRGTDGLFSIWVGDGTDLFRVVIGGNPNNAGTTVQTDLGLGRIGITSTTLSTPFIQGLDLNDAGDLVFVASLVNDATPTQSWGRGVFVVTVPTPASAALLGLGGLIATRRRRASR